MESITPIKDAIEKYLSKNPIRLHIPFHNGISINDYFSRNIFEYDLSEVTGLDLEGFNNPIYKSESNTAKLFNASHSFYLTNGASSGMLAALLAIKKLGKKVIIARNVHKSVINGLVLSGLDPIWIDVDFLNDWGIFGKVNLDSLKNILKKESDIAACIMVSPTYEGIISDVKSMSELCHSYNIPLIVDEAHGAHLYFSYNLNSALSLGADIVIQSWHKSLGSLTQTGVMHLVSDKYINYHDLRRSLDLITSTSPSYLLLLSLELITQHLFEKGSYYLLNSLTFSKTLKTKLETIEGLKCAEVDDESKIYVKHKAYSGLNLAAKLYENHNIETESANQKGILLYPGISLSESMCHEVYRAFNDECKTLINLDLEESTIPAPKNISFKTNPREAFFNPNPEVETEIIAPCPPGYVEVAPGGLKNQ